MKELKLSLYFVLTMQTSFAMAASSTGAYCSNGQYVSFSCGRGNPGGWNDQGNGCYAKVTRPSCEAIQNDQPTFNWTDYGTLNGDVVAAGVDRLNHWKTDGKAGSRNSAWNFRVMEYLAHPSNGDLKNAFGTNYAAAISHWAAYGLLEGRPPRSTQLLSPAWQVDAYNPDTNYQQPQDAVPRFAIYAVGSKSTYTQAELNNDTHLDTSPITGIANPYRLGAGATLKAPPQDLINDVWGFHGVQQYGGEFAIGIYSRPIKQSINEFYSNRRLSGKNEDIGLATIVLQKGVDTPELRWKPWQNNQVLRTSLDIRIPFAGGTANSGNNLGGSQVADYYYIRNRITGSLITLSASFFDTRPDTPAPITVIPNAPGGWNIVSIPLSYDSQYITVPRSSSFYKNTTFKETNHFEYYVTSDNMRNANS